MLARHHGVVAKLVTGGVSHITGCVHRIIALDLQVAIHVQAPQAVTLAADLFGERVGLEAHRPHHGIGVDALAVVQQHTGRVNRSDCGTAHPLHPQRLASLFDGRADAVSQRSTHPGAAVDD
ncbi:hypothetical protein D3C81_1510650 [compost metagenome]